MWYRSVLAQILPDKQLIPSQISKENMYPELEEILTKMGKNTDDYYQMTKDQQEEIWNMLVMKSGSNSYNGFEGEDTSGFDAMEAASDSSYQDKRLEDARHENTDVYPGKLNENIRGVEQIRGTYQERSRKTEPRIFGNLPSNISLI